MYWWVHIVSDQYIWSVWNTQSDLHTHTVCDIFERIHQIRHIGLTIYTHTQSPQLYTQIHTNTSDLSETHSLTDTHTQSLIYSSEYIRLDILVWLYIHTHKAPNYEYKYTPIHLICTNTSKTRYINRLNSVRVPCIRAFQIFNDIDL